MLDPGLLAFACGALPAPARVLEIGAGGGEPAAALRDMGHDVTAIDPAAEPGTGVEAVALLDATGIARHRGAARGRAPGLKRRGRPGGRPRRQQISPLA